LVGQHPDGQLALADQPLEDRPAGGIAQSPEKGVGGSLHACWITYGLSISQAGGRNAVSNPPNFPRRVISTKQVGGENSAEANPDVGDPMMKAMRVAAAPLAALLISGLIQPIHPAAAQANLQGTYNLDPATAGNPAMAIENVTGQMGFFKR